MDDFKKGTNKDYTIWDLNCPSVVRPDNALRKRFKRKYRRKEKENLKQIKREGIDNYD
jgi:hypothetical protein